MLVLTKPKMFKLLHLASGGVMGCWWWLCLYLNFDSTSTLPPFFSSFSLLLGVCLCDSLFFFCWQCSWQSSLSPSGCLCYPPPLSDLPSSGWFFLFLCTFCLSGLGSLASSLSIIILFFFILRFVSSTALVFSPLFSFFPIILFLLSLFFHFFLSFQNDERATSDLERRDKGALPSVFFPFRSYFPPWEYTGLLKTFTNWKK